MFDRMTFAAFLVLLLSGPAAISEEAPRVPQNSAPNGAASSAVTNTDEYEMKVGGLYLDKKTIRAPSTASRSWRRVFRRLPSLTRRYSGLSKHIYSPQPKGLGTSRGIEEHTSGLCHGGSLANGLLSVCRLC